MISLPRIPTTDRCLAPYPPGGRASATVSGIMLCMQQDIEFVSAAHTLAATISTPVEGPNRGPDTGILFVHGLGSNRRGYVEYGERATAQLGVSCLALDLSGHGSSTGDANDISPAQHVQDVLAAWDQLTARYGADSGRIGVCGSSYGACIAALAVQHRTAARLLLRAPAIVADSDLHRPLRLRSSDRSPAAASGLLRSLNDFHAPALVVESENDEEIPHEIIEAYLSALPAGEYAVISGATHGLSHSEWRETFVRQLISFFAGL